MERHFNEEDEAKQKNGWGGDYYRYRYDITGRALPYVYTGACTQPTDSTNKTEEVPESTLLFFRFLFLFLKNSIRNMYM